MTLTIAIQPDEVRHANGELQSFSTHWTELAEQQGIHVRKVDAYSPDLFDKLADCDGFMWRFGYDARSLQFAKRLLPAIEHGMKLPVFPSWTTAWHFEDKVSQHFLLLAAGIPMPRTWVFWHQDAALQFCKTAIYPLVFKLSGGIQSNNVRLIKNVDDAALWVRRMFGPGLDSVQLPYSRLRQALKSQYRTVRLLIDGYSPALPRGIQHGYFYAQEFLQGNEFDTRVTVIGDRAFAFRRMNRPGDFRASGSGRIDWDPAPIDLETVRLAFRIARQLQTQSVAIDGLRRGEERLVGEISYTYASWAVRDCPGHWILRGESQKGPLEWVDGKLHPEVAIFTDFVSKLRNRDRLMAGGLAPDVLQ